MAKHTLSMSTRALSISTRHTSTHTRARECFRACLHTCVCSGTHVCSEWDEMLPPHCADATGRALRAAPEWCTSKFCYVDKSRCDQADVKQSHMWGQSVKLWYSYRCSCATFVYRFKNLNICLNTRKTNKQHLRQQEQALKLQSFAQNPIVQELKNS